MTAAPPPARRPLRPASWAGARVGALAVAAAAALAACSGGQSGSAFVSLSVDAFSEDGQTPIAAAVSVPNSGVSTSVCATLRNTLKNPTVTAPTPLDNVVIQSYTVTLRRPDGSILIPPFTISTSVLVPAGTATQGVVSGNTGTVPVILVPSGQKPSVAPLVASAEVDFRGRDGRGADVGTEGGIAVQFSSTGTDTQCGVVGGGTTGGTTGGGATTGTTGATTGTTGTTTGTTGGTTGTTTGTTTGGATAGTTGT